MTPITIATLVAPTCVIPALRVGDFAQAVTEMARTAPQGSTLDPNAAREAILTRGGRSSFALGRGVAIPHAMVEGLDEPLGVFARLDPALELDAADAVPIDLVLLILSTEEPATLLRALACGARRLRDCGVTARLRSADGAEAIHAVLTSDGWRGGELLPEPHRAEAPQGTDLTSEAKWPSIVALC